MMKGVDLGNWLVLEKWMSPELFDGTSAEDEVHLWRELSETAARERFKVHRDSWVRERDFVYLAANGIELIRIPVPFFIFGDVAPYVGCIEYLDEAFEWAQRHGQKIRARHPALDIIATRCLPLVVFRYEGECEPPCRRRPVP